MPVLATLVILVVLATGCATRGSVRRVESDVGKLSADVALLREAQAQTARDSARVLSHLESIDGSLREIRTRMTQTATEVEGQGTRLRAAEDRLGGVRGEAVARAVPPPVQPPVPAPPAPAQPPVSAKPPLPTQPLPTPAPAPVVVPAPAPLERPARETLPRGRTAESAYGVALATFKAREHGQAVLQFLDFLARYPGHPLNINAQYWIGEAYYSQRDYRQALLEFEKVLAMPVPAGSGKPADAMLKVGLCYSNLREPARAEQAWQRLLQEHPTSTAAGHARNFLRSRRASTIH
jgi:tol-pal system protein YbgF